MILDALTKFSGAQALTAQGTIASTNVMDLGVARDMGVAHYELKILAQVVTTFTSNGAATLQVLVQGSTDNSTFYTMAEGPVVALASLVAGARPLQIDMPRPAAGQAVPRYLRLAYVVATADMTAGTIDGYLVVDRRDNHFYPSGITILN